MKPPDKVICKTQLVDAIDEWIVLSLYAVYDYLHKKHIEQVAKIRRFQDVYKSM